MNTESPRPKLPLKLPLNNGTGSTVKKRARTWSTWFASAVRWLHIYVSLLGFTALIFFSITGITLNHPSWFGVNADSVTELKGEMKTEWLQTRGSAAVSESSEEVDPVDTVAKLEIVEHLRNQHGIRGAVGEFRADEVECMIVFKGPGYAADTFIDRQSGHYTITETRMGAIAIMNDLHKGRDSGLAWSWIIDITAIVTIFVSVTGLVLLFYIKRKRFAGVVTAVVGTIALVVIYVMYVP